MARVLVVGGTDATDASCPIGQHVVDFLCRKGFQVAFTCQKEQPPPSPPQSPTHAGTAPRAFYMAPGDSVAIRSRLEAFRPEAIIDLAGVRYGMYLESPERAHVLNHDCVMALMEAIDAVLGKENCCLLFYSSELVYSSSDSVIAESSTAIEPIGPHAKDKLAVERAIRERMTRWTIFRSSFHYGLPLGRNISRATWVSRTISSLLKSEKVYAFVDEYRTPVYVADAAAIIGAATARLLEDKQAEPRVYNLTSGDMVTRYQFCRQLCAIGGFDQNLVIPVTQAAFDYGVPRPRKLHLSNATIMTELHAPQTTVSAGIKLLLDRPRANSWKEVEDGVTSSSISAEVEAKDEPEALAGALNAFEAQYTPKNILVTGGAGFIGSHLVIHLVTKYPQYKIVNLDKLDYCSSLKNLEGIADKPNYKFIKGDIRRPDFVNYIFRTEQIDTVLHLAAQTHVDNSFGNSFTFTQTNVFGTHVLLEAAKRVNIRRFIHVSTDEVYGEGGDHASTEGAAMEPTNPYAATKAAAEMICKSYLRSFKVPVIITRGNNVYGPHQFPEKLIPKFINLLLQGKPCTLHGSGRNQRNYLFAPDTARAFDAVLHKGVVGEIYNVGSTVEKSNIEVTRALLQELGLPEEGNVDYVRDRNFNDLRYPITCEKLYALGWKPEVGFEEGIKKTVEWYKKNSGNWGDLSRVLVAHPRLPAHSEYM